MITVKRREPQRGDIVYRLKENGSGWHYGRLAETVNVVPPEHIGPGYYSKFVVPHTTASRGKHLDTPEGFFRGLPGGWIPQEFAEPQRNYIEQRSVSDLGKPYSPFDTCEDDVFGFSPTRNNILGGLMVLGLVVAFGAALAD